MLREEYSDAELQSRGSKPLAVKEWHPETWLTWEL